MMKSPRVEIIPAVRPTRATASMSDARFMIERLLLTRPSTFASAAW